MSSSIRRLFAGASSKNPQAKPHRERRFRPSLDHLEDRIVPSAFHVVNLSDVSSGFGTSGSLRYCITQANANPGSTIDFTPGLTGTINLNSVLNITQAVEIDGPGAGVITLSGRNLNQVFVINTTNQVTITDLTIANGRSSFAGGAIYNFAPLTLSRVTFVNNQSSDGGALYNRGSAAATTVSDCVFTNNHVANHYIVWGGAMTSFGGTLTVINTQFTNNYALGLSNMSGLNLEGVAEGGAVNCFEDLGTDTFSGCTFTGNSARGGTNCSGNAGYNYIGIGQGGAIDVEGSTVEIDNHCTFTNNYAQGGQASDTVAGSFGRIGFGLGGAIEVSNLDPNAGQLTVNDSTFSGNRAVGANNGHVQAGTDSNQGVGGAINDEGAINFLTVAGCTFTGNSAKGGVSGIFDGSNGYYGAAGVGGAINLYFSASGDISGSNFSNNSAIAANGTGDAHGGFALGGAIDTFPTSLTISDTQFANNRVQGGNGGPFGAAGGYAAGGGLYADGGGLNLWNLTFTSNRAIGGNGLGSGNSGGEGAGGGMLLTGTLTTADSLNLQSNWAQGGSGLNGANGGYGAGGGLYTLFNSLVQVSDSTITLNTAQGGFGGTSFGGYGGGIFEFESSIDVLQLINTNVFANHASTAGDDFYFI
jgi:hypothetical protein